ncbi:MAG: MBL fold metallo-hydrolase [Luteitalea sp.]|nr:MBL fold metallo-hydrolase [Luteitalea sp.]
MPLSRREFIVTSSLAVTAGALRPASLLGQQTPAPPVVPTFEALRSNVGTFTARGGTIGWFVGPDAVVVVDSQFPDTAQMFLDGLKSRTQRKIDVFINTHHHGDHTGGNKLLRSSAIKMVAHENEPGLQKKQAAAAKTEDAQAYPDETFKDSWKANVGNEVVTAKYYGPGHTSGDVAVFFERANVVHMGDLMFSNRHPRVDRPSGASIKNWIALLDQVTKEHGADTIYIFGHAKAGMPVKGSRADLLGFRDYFTALLDYVQKGISAGKSADEITKVAALPGFTGFEGVPTGTLQMAYEELTAKA